MRSAADQLIMTRAEQPCTTAARHVSRDTHGTYGCCLFGTHTTHTLYIYSIMHQLQFLFMHPEVSDKRAVYRIPRRRSMYTSHAFGIAACLTQRRHARHARHAVLMHTQHIVSTAHLLHPTSSACI